MFEKAMYASKNRRICLIITSPVAENVRGVEVLEANDTVVLRVISSVHIDLLELGQHVTTQTGGAFTENKQAGD